MDVWRVGPDSYTRSKEQKLRKMQPKTETKEVPWQHKNEYDLKMITKSKTTSYIKQPRFKTSKKS